MITGEKACLGDKGVLQPSNDQERRLCQVFFAALSLLLLPRIDA